MATSKSSAVITGALGGGKTDKITRLQKFVVEEVQRSTIQGASYNPRQIDAHAAKKLRTNIQKNGLLLPILVNRRTGNVVAGHQRLAALDALEGKPEYMLRVAYCDLTPKQEREQNIFMNNESAQGSWDVDMLEELVKSTNIDVSLAGFEDADLQLLLPDWTPLEEAPAEKVAFTPEEAASEKQADKIAEIKAAKKKYLDKSRAENDTEFFIVTVFRSRAELDQFLDSINVDRREKYISPAVLLEGAKQLATGKVSRANKKAR
jgi:ParB-like chromosome segregation protein Spo0J